MPEGVQRVGRIERRAVDGVLLLDKPAGLSSTSALGRAKFLFEAKKGGHTGTLDPFATGLLPLCFGEATKFARFMLDAEKSYVATLKLGAESTSGDTEGEIVAQRPVALSAAQIDAALARFVGKQTQVPPMHSAIKMDGVPLYRLARKGIEIERVARDIEVLSLTRIDWDPAQVTLVIEARVSKGTYLRVLAQDIGRALDCGAYLTALRRTATGGFRLADAITLDQLERLSRSARDQLLLPPAALCAALPALTLSADDARIFSHGGWLTIAASGASAEGERQVRSADGRFLGVGQLSADQTGLSRLTPSRLMSSESP